MAGFHLKYIFMRLNHSFYCHIPKVGEYPLVFCPFFNGICFQVYLFSSDVSSGHSFTSSFMLELLALFLILKSSILILGFEIKLLERNS